MTVKELIEVLSDFKSSYDCEVAIMPADAELSTKNCRGGIYFDGGILVWEKAQDDGES